MIHILIVNNEHLVSDLLAQVLNTQDDMRVIEQVSTSTAALEALNAQPCDVLLLDLLLNDQGARQLSVTQLIATVARTFPHIQCLVIGLLESDTVILRCLEMGVAGYLHQDDSLDDLVIKVRCAARGEALISPRVAAALLARLVELKALATTSNGYNTVSLHEQVLTLTPREREILALIGLGHSNRQIADLLVITLGTVKNHVHNILDKLDVHTRRQATMIAQQVITEQEFNNDSSPIVASLSMDMQNTDHRRRQLNASVESLIKIPRQNV